MSNNKKIKTKKKINYIDKSVLLVLRNEKSDKCRQAWYRNSNYVEQMMCLRI